VTEAALLANGVTAKVRSPSLIVTTSIDHVRAGAKTIDVKRVWITEEGSKAIEVGWSFRFRRQTGRRQRYVVTEEDDPSRHFSLDHLL
jgi:hypothetical protein